MKTSGSFKNKKDAKKDLVFILLEPIWKDMRFRLAEIKKQGIQHETISDQSNSSNEKAHRNRAHRSSRDKNSNTNAPLGGVIGNGASNSTHLPSGLSDSSSSCTLSRIQNQSMNHPLPPNMNHPSNQRGPFHPHMVTNGQKENFLPANQNRYPIPPGQNNGAHPMVPNGGYLNRQMHPNMVKSYPNGTSGGGGGGPNGYNEIGIETKNYTNGHNPIGHPTLYDSKSLVGQMANMAIRPPGSAPRKVFKYIYGVWPSSFRQYREPSQEVMLRPLELIILTIFMQYILDHIKVNIPESVLRLDHPKQDSGIFQQVFYHHRLK